MEKKIESPPKKIWVTTKKYIYLKKFHVNGDTIRIQELIQNHQNMVVFGPNTMIFGAKTVVFGGKYSGILGKYNHILGKYSSV